MKKISFFAVVAVMMFSCAEDQSDSLVFSVQEFSSEDFTACENQKCPTLDIGYLEAEGKEAISEKINEQLEKDRIQLFAADPDQPAPATLETALQEFIAKYQEFNEDYPEFPAGYELRISEDIAYRTEKILVVKTKHYLFTGGAHGYGGTNFSTFSVDTGKLLEPSELFENLPAFTKYAEAKFRDKYKIPKGTNINSTGFFFENDQFSLPNNLAILKDEVVLIYNPYEAAAYAYGVLELRFPKTAVKQWLRFE